MKTRMLIVSSGRYDSAQSGSARRYRLSKEQVRTLGQGDKVVFETRIASLDANCEVVVSVATSTNPEFLPGDGGQVVLLKEGATGNQSTVLLNGKGRKWIETETLLQSEVEFVFEVKHASNASLVTAELVVFATIYHS